MRINLPVTGHEVAFPHGESVVSTTDVQGRITYCNDTFVRLSGYAREELLGQPHNILRHPDMPAEAFRDLWDTVSEGRMWTGVVKNRCKDGNHYWVVANVTPLMVAGRVVGHLSVRTEPARDQVRACEALYARMSDEARAGRLLHRVSRGEVWKDTAWGRLVLRLRRTDPDHRLWAVSLGATASAAGMGWLFARADSAVAQGLSVVGLTAFGVAGYVWNRRTWLQPLRAVEKCARQLAAGDLTVSIDAAGMRVHPGVRLALTQLVMNVRAVLQEVRREAGMLQGAVVEVSAGNEHLAHRTQAQAVSLESSITALEKMTSNVRDSFDQAQSATTLTSRACDQTGQTHHTVTDMVASMDSVGRASQRVADITQVIEGIAFQTNILALNASVEAARAGEHGRGFAVVAAEVRSLAQRSSAAAREIKALIDESTHQVEAGRRITHATRDSIDQTVSVVRDVGSLSEKIAHSVGEQLAAISAINGAVEELDGVTKQNTMMVEELSAASGTLRRQSVAMVDATRLFRLHPEDPLHISGVDAVELRKAGKRLQDRALDATAFDMRAYVQAHADWKIRFRAAIETRQTLDAETICRDDRCALGRWLYTHGQPRWGHSPGFRQLLDQHAQFHKASGVVATCINRGDMVQAKSLLDEGSDYVRASTAVLELIRTFARQIDGERGVGATTEPSGGASTAPSTSAGAAMAPSSGRVASGVSEVETDWAAF